MMQEAQNMLEAFAVYDPASGQAWAVCRSPLVAAVVLDALRAVAPQGIDLCLVPWVIPAEMMEAE